MRCALCTSRSTMPSASVGSPICSRQRESGSCEVRIVECTWKRSSQISQKSRRSEEIGGRPGIKRLSMGVAGVSRRKGTEVRGDAATHHSRGVEIERCLNGILVLRGYAYAGDQVVFTILLLFLRSRATSSATILRSKATAACAATRPSYILLVHFAHVELLRCNHICFSSRLPLAS